MRGSAPGRAQPEDLRPGSFKHGHEKCGGRKPGTPNLFSRDYKRAIVEAAYRIGQDGNGKNGVKGYFSWVAIRHPPAFCTILVSLLPFEFAESSTLAQPRRTTGETDQWLREYIGLKEKNRAQRQTVQIDSQSWAWTGQDFPVGALMQLAVENPKAFCALVVAAFLRPPTKRRAALWPQAGAEREQVDSSDDARSYPGDQLER
jgi:hypothetical protein